MWKRERMMVDVISLQKPEDASTLQSSPLIPKLTNTNDSLPITQNRHYYAFQGLHDRQTRFYPGYEYDVFGEHSIDDKQFDDKRSKRPLDVDDDKDNKKQKLAQPTPTPSFAFSSKPYDAMDNLMYFYWSSVSYSACSVKKWKKLLKK